MITPEQLASSGSESGSQKALFCWAASSGIPELKWLFSIPNGFYATPAQKAKMKAEGLRSGVSDICLPVRRAASGQEGWMRYIHRYEPQNDIACCGLYIEMKTEDKRNRKNGELSDEQKEFGEFVTGQGYKFCVCYSWSEARDALLKYLGRM